MEDEKEMLDPVEDAAEDPVTEDHEEAPEDAAEETAQETAPDAEAEDDFAYDEDGNIIIPDEIDEGSPSDEGKEENAAPDARDVELQRLREELDDLRSQSKDTLKKLGIETEDVMDGLASLAAESADETKEDYLAKRAETRKAEREAQAKRVAEFEELAAKDLAELQQFYPDTKAYKHVRDMPEEILEKFARNRNLGLPAKEAYAAANIDGIRSGAVQAGHRRAMNDSKAHLQASTPKSAKGDGIRIPHSEMEMWRGMFPEKSDKEIAALYKKTL